MVASSTRKAWAISVVVRPPSVRSVSATCASSESAGWQQVKISSRRSSGKAVSSTASSVVRGASSRWALPSSTRARRIRSSARLRPTVISHADGIPGDAVARPALGCAREGVLRGFLGEVEIAEEADQGGDDAAPVLAEGVLDQYSTIARTSIAPPIRAAGMRAASASAASRSGTSKR